MGRDTSKSHRDLAGGGRGGGAALGSYRQSGGANSTRKTWGALVGETGRSQLTSTVTLDTVGGGRGPWGEEVTGMFPRQLEKRLMKGGHSSPWPQEEGLRGSRDEKEPQSPPESRGTALLGSKPAVPAT